MNTSRQEKFRLSLIVCAHNPDTELLREVLDHIREQTLDTSLWELVLIDNGSKNPLEGCIDLSWHENGRIIREDELGLTPARWRGIRETEGDLIVFADDDNLLKSTYLEKVLQIGKAFPQLGVWSGQLKPKCAVDVPSELRPWLVLLGVREFDKDYWSNYRDYDRLPVGAGMSGRRAVFEGWVKACKEDPIRKILGRRGTSLAGAEDSDIGLTAIEMGYGVGSFHELELIHVFPERRLNRDYLLKLQEALACSEYLLRFTRDPSAGFLQQSPVNRLYEYYICMRKPPMERAFFKAKKRGQTEAAKIIHSTKGKGS